MALASREFTPESPAKGFFVQIQAAAEVRVHRQIRPQLRFGALLMDPPYGLEYPWATGRRSALPEPWVPVEAPRRTFIGVERKPDYGQIARARGRSP